MKHYLIFAATIAALAGLALAGNSWLAAHDARLRLEATLAAQQKIIAAAEDRERQRERDVRDALEQVTRLKRSVRTPEQALRELPAYLPLPAPITLESAPLSPEAAGAPGSSGLPAAPVARLPLEDLKPLFDFAAECHSCRLELDAAKETLADERARAAALAGERDAAVKAAKGGGFWARLKRGAKWFVIGGAVGAAAVAASRR